MADTVVKVDSENVRKTSTKEVVMNYRKEDLIKTRAMLQARIDEIDGLLEVMK